MEAPLRRRSAASASTRASSVLSWLLTASSSFCWVACGQALELHQTSGLFGDALHGPVVIESSRS